MLKFILSYISYAIESIYQCYQIYYYLYINAIESIYQSINQSIKSFRTLICRITSQDSAALSVVDLGGIPLSRAPQIPKRNTRVAGAVIRPDYQFSPRFEDLIFRLAS